VRQPTKTVTVLITDLVGSTAQAELLGRQEALTLSNQHLAALRDSLAVHRATEVKSTGDGVMAVFDSASNGVACAITMQRAIARHNRRMPGRELSVRIGISLGEAAPVGGDWYGTPVVEAARLCSVCEGGQIYLTDVVRQIVGSGESMYRLNAVGALELKGLRQPVVTWSVDWNPQEEFGLRVALADDSAVLRQGVAMALRSVGMEVVLETADAATLETSLAAVSPHVVVVDVRMPPSYTTEGLDAAIRIRRDHPDVGVLVLSAAVDPEPARRLLATVTNGVGYLLKDRITDMDELTAAIRTVASGGSAIDPEVVNLLEPYQV
jgi:class 3 adenylate cyclase/CheY-like chemotaxis protein